MDEDLRVDYFMPWFFGDYLKDTSDLTLEEHGAYMLLMGHMWNRGGTLPADTGRLARLLHIDPLTFDRVWVEISRFFQESGDGLLMQKRLLKELEKARGRKVAASENGKRGAAARWGKDGDQNGKNMARPSKTDGVAIVSPIANRMAKNSSPSPSPSPSPNTDTDPETPTRAPGTFIEPIGVSPKKTANDDPNANVEAPRARNGVTGYELARRFGLIRSEAISNTLPWSVTLDRGGAVDKFAASINMEAAADVEPTIRRFFEHVVAGDPDWDDPRLAKDPSFAFGSWRSRFTRLREEIRGLTPQAKAKEHPNMPPMFDPKAQLR